MAMVVTPMSANPNKKWSAKPNKKCKNLPLERIEPSTSALLAPRSTTELQGAVGAIHQPNY